MCEKNNDGWNFNKKYNKCKIIIVVKYTITHNIQYKSLTVAIFTVEYKIILHVSYCT